MGAAGAQAVANLLRRGDADSLGTPLHVTGTYTVKPHERSIHADGATSFTVTMPEAGEAAIGLPYMVRLVDDGTGTITVDFPGAGEQPGSWALTAIGDFGVAVTDGRYWVELNTQET